MKNIKSCLPNGSLLDTFVLLIFILFIETANILAKLKFFNFSNT